ncbi:glycerol acyltransferase [Candidatus Magnetomorum sp. HK-1]|nr:glycerol acyltransferase [Candidatus Magnetomorum sp. HK-1]
MLQNSLKKFFDSKTELPINGLFTPAGSGYSPKINYKTDNKEQPCIAKQFIKNRMDNLSKYKHNTKKLDENSVFWDLILDYYFRLEMTGWEHLPDKASMLVGIHSGTWLTMDAWTLCAQWRRIFNKKRILNATAHDVLMSLPMLGKYFRSVGVIPANRKSVTKAFAKGHDVVIWPGGEVDAMRSWSKRDKVILGGRTGFIRQAIRSGVSIVPVATIGGTETVFVLSECRKIAKMLNLKKHLRCEIFPLVLGFPFGVTFEVLPMHIPLPAKIRTKILEPIKIDNDPDKENDNDYVMKKYREIENCIQEGVNHLASKRKFPIYN